MQQNTTLGKIFALIPAYNESNHIASVVTHTLVHLPVLVIDDGSSDNTSEQASRAGAILLHQTPNQGKGAALKNGFRQVLEWDIDAIIMLDADGQHNPEEIPKFIDTFKEYRSDLIIGKRDFSYMPWLRKLANTFGTWIFSWAVGTGIPDNQSGYRLLSRRMMEATLSSNETRFEFEVDMIIACIQHHYRLDWVPIQTIYGDEKSHIRPLSHSYNFFRMVWRAKQAVKQCKTR